MYIYDAMISMNFMFLEHRKEQSDNHQSETVNEVICRSSEPQENGGNEKKERDSLREKEEREEEEEGEKEKGEEEEEEEGEGEGEEGEESGESGEGSDSSEETESEDEEGNTFKVLTTKLLEDEAAYMYTHLLYSTVSLCCVYQCWQSLRPSRHPGARSPTRT